MTETTLPPGDRGLPLLGETLDFLKDQFRFVDERRARFGKVFRSNILFKDTALLVGAEGARVFNDESQVQRAGGMAPHIEQLLRARKMDVPVSKRILELNTGHPVVANLERAYEVTPDSDDVRSWIRTLYDQSLIAEGSPLEDPADFARRLTALVEKATALRA